jgi:hypothetical protein
MESTASHVHIPPLGHHQHNEVGRKLRTTLAELIDLSLIVNLSAPLRCR